MSRRLLVNLLLFALSVCCSRGLSELARVDCCSLQPQHLMSPTLSCCLNSLTDLYWISPRRGTIAGGTRIAIGGSGFSTDAYTGANLVYLGGIPCDVDWYTATRNRLECITRPYPGSYQGFNAAPLLEARVISGGLEVMPMEWDTRYQYFWDDRITPQVSTGEHFRCALSNPPFAGS